MENKNEYEYLVNNGQFDADILEHYEISYKVHNKGKQINVVNSDGVTLSYYPTTHRIVINKKPIQVLDNQTVYDLIKLIKKEE